MRFYRDGALIAGGTTPTLSAATATSLYVGDMAEGWAGTPTGTISKAVVHPRALSASEIAELTANPWQLFARPAARVFVSTAAATVPARYYYDMIASGGRLGG